MVPGSAATATTDLGDRYGSDSSWVNALIGAVVGIVLSFIPLSPVLSGAVAGYLDGGDRSTGLRVGAMAGLIMLIPFVLFGFAMLAFMGFGMGFGMGSGAPVLFVVMLLFMLFFGALYTVGGSAVGGFLCIYLKDEL